MDDMMTDIHLRDYYKAKQTLDAKDKAQARAYKAQYGEPEGQLAFLWWEFKILCAAILGILTPMPYGFFIMITLFIMMWLFRKKPQEGEDPRKGYEVWKIWMELREKQYYGERYMGWSIMSTLMYSCVRRDEFASTHSRDSIQHNIWGGSVYDFKWLDPEKLTRKLRDGTRDYTKYLDELAYRYIVLMTREGYRPTIVNFTEAVSYFAWGDGVSPGGSMQPLIFGSHNPFNTHPMKAEQKEMLCSFDYTVLDSGACKWIEDIWAGAERRCNSELALRNSVKSIGSFAVDEYHRINAIYDRMDAAQPRIVNEKYEREKDSQLYEFYVNA